MSEHDEVLCVQVFGLIEVEPERYAFGFAHTYTLPPEVSPSQLEEALCGLGAAKTDRLPLE